MESAKNSNVVTLNADEAARIRNQIGILRESIESNPQQPELLRNLSEASLYIADIPSCFEFLFRWSQLDLKNREPLDFLCKYLMILPLDSTTQNYFRKMVSQYQDNPAFMRKIERAAIFIETKANLSPAEREQLIDQSLHKVGDHHHTDKASETDSHCYAGLNYMDIYEPYFSPLRHQPINFLEIGVNAGFSHNAWAEYFPRATIYGLDINPSSKQYESERIRITIGSQADPAVLAQLSSHAKGFEIVLDDGSHATEHMQTSFKYLWPQVKPGGIYIIEDVGCTYSHPDMQWSGMKYNSESQLYNSRQEFEEFILKHVRAIDKEQGDVLSVHFWHYIVVILKRQQPALLKR